MSSPAFSRSACAALLVLAALVPLSASAAAQFDDFTWTFVSTPGGATSGSGTVDSETMHIQGPDGPGVCSPDNACWFETTAVADGVVVVHFDWDNQDVGFGSWLADFPFYSVDGVKTYVQSGMGSGFEYADFQKTVSFEVAAGQSFGFGVGSSDCEWGPGVLELTDFVFQVDAWSPLGGALAGALGEPTLVGLGSLNAGTAWTLSLTDAQPSAVAWMVLGSAVHGAPFKGGLLMPTPDLLLALVTAPTGRIVLNGTWPAGVAPDTTLVIQYWIEDAGAPEGWAASNGVAAITP